MDKMCIKFEKKYNLSIFIRIDWIVMWIIKVEILAEDGFFVSFYRKKLV